MSREDGLNLLEGVSYRPPAGARGGLGLADSLECLSPEEKFSGGEWWVVVVVDQI